MTTQNITEHEGSKYLKPIHSPLGGDPIMVDVYAVIDAYAVTCPARAHAIKKLLCAGQRGKGDSIADLKGAVAAANRAVELEAVREEEDDDSVDTVQAKELLLAKQQIKRLEAVIKLQTTAANRLQAETPVSLTPHSEAVERLLDLRELGDKFGDKMAADAKELEEIRNMPADTTMVFKDLAEGTPFKFIHGAGVCVKLSDETYAPESDLAKMAGTSPESPVFLYTAAVSEEAMAALEAIKLMPADTTRMFKDPKPNPATPKVLTPEEALTRILATPEADAIEELAKFRKDSKESDVLVGDVSKEAGGE